MPGKSVFTGRVQARPGARLGVANGWEFKSINPQNRAYYLLKDLCDILFKE
jgi:hypothetical protein